MKTQSLKPGQLIILLLMVFLIPINLFGQQAITKQPDTINKIKSDSVRILKNDPHSIMLQNKIDHYRGRIVLGGCLAGAGVLIGGIGVFVLSDPTHRETNDVDDFFDNFGHYLVGGVLTGIGLGLLIPGTVILINSIIKLNDYKSQQQGFSLETNSDPGQIGLTLKYKF